MTESNSQPPRLATRVLERFVGKDNPLIGDLDEEWQQRRSVWWYWRQMLMAIVTLRRRSLARLGVLGLSVVLMLPALLLVTSGLLFSLFDATGMSNALDFGSPVFRPAVIVGGLAGAFAINVSRLVRVRVDTGHMVGTLRLQGRLAELSVVVLIGLVVSVIVVYLLAENLHIFAS